MKIHILFNFQPGPYGGGNQFLKGLKKIFEKKRYYEKDPLRADAIIFNSFPFDFEFKAINILCKLKKRGKILVHRIDGPISCYRGKDEQIDQEIYQLNDFFADGTIFQSEYSRKENKKLGLKSRLFETVIINAPDSGIFNINNKLPFSTLRKTKLIATSWSSNWNKGFSVYQWLDEHLDFNKYQMTFIGNSPLAFKNIRLVKPLASKDLAQELKQHDIYIIASKNDPCSNALIEALHCGLPAIVYNSGGHPEIVKNGGKIFKMPEEIPDMIQKIKNNYQFYQKNISLFDVNSVADKYLNFIFNIRQKYTTGEQRPEPLIKRRVTNIQFKIFQQKIAFFLKNMFNK